MAVKKHTTDEMVADVKRRASLPTVQSLFTDQDIVDFLDEELHNTVVPLIMDVREEYFVATVNVPYVVGQEFYAIPERAIGTKLRDVVMYTDANGTVTNIPRWSREMIASRTRRADNQNTVAFYVQGNHIGLFPIPNQTGTMQFSYFLRPGHLVLEAECVYVLSKSYNAGTGIASLNTPDPTGTGIDDTGVIDIIHARAPFNTQIDLTVSAYDYANPFDQQVEMTQEQYDEVTPADGTYFFGGDWLSQAGTSPIAQVPLEGHYMIVQAATVKVLESMGSERELKVAQEKYTIAKENFLTTITDRVEGESKKVIGGNSILNHTRSGTFSRTGWWR